MATHKICLLSDGETEELGEGKVIDGRWVSGSVRDGQWVPHSARESCHLHRHVTVAQAWARVDTGTAEWVGPRQIRSLQEGEWRTVKSTALDKTSHIKVTTRQYRRAA